MGAGDGGGSLIMTDDRINCSDDDRGIHLGLTDMRQDEPVANVDERVSE